MHSKGKEGYWSAAELADMKRTRDKKPARNLIERAKHGGRKLGALRRRRRAAQES